MKAIQKQIRVKELFDEHIQNTNITCTVISIHI